MSLYVDGNGHYAQVNDCINIGFNGAHVYGKCINVYPNGSKGRHSIFSKEFASEEQAVACLMENYPDMREVTGDEYIAARDGRNYIEIDYTLE